MSAAQLFLPASRAFNSNGLPVAGAVLKLYTTGTLVPQPMYSDSALTISLGSSVTANAAGRFDTIYQDNATPFRLRIEDASGAELDDIDPFYFGQMDVSLDTIYPAAAGTLAEMPTKTIPTGIDIVSTTGADVIDEGGANYVAGTAPTSHSGFTSANSRNFVLSKEQIIVPLQFYDATDPDLWDSFDRALAYLKATGNPWQAHGYDGPGAAKLLIPKLIYPMGGRTLDITCGLIMEGEGGSLNGPGSSVLVWSSNVTGIRVQAPNTSGASTTGLSNSFSGDGALLRNFSMDGAYGSGAESEAHGIHMRGHAQVENVFIDRFAGEGIRIQADASGNNGNANNWLVVNSQVQRCRNGLYIVGPDTNAGHSIGFCANANRRWGILDSSFLGNAHYAPHAAQNGFVGFGDGVTLPVTLVHKSGRLFTPVHGQEATASITSPPASKSDTAYWLYYTDGVADTGIPDWFSGVLVRSGGSYCGDQSAATGEFNNPYSESDSILAQVFGSWRITGGIQGSGNPAGNGQYHYAGNNEYNVGYLRGAAADYSYNIGHTNFAYFNFYSYTVAGTTRALTGGLRAFPGGYMASLFTTEWDYVRNGTTIAYWDASGLTLQTGYKLSVNALPVVGARKTGWAVDTGTAKRTANATYSGTAEVGYTQATIQTLMDAVRDLSQTVKALKDDLHGTAGHGLIGT